MLLHRDNVTKGKRTDFIALGGRTIARHDISQDEVTYPHADHLGSPVAATAENGTLLWRESYTPFGEKRRQPSANSNSQGYTGHIEDTKLGLTYMQARFYDPVVGRFLSNDPVGAVGHLKTQNGIHGVNRYAYANNNPYLYTDPTGMESYLDENQRRDDDFSKRRDGNNGGCGNTAAICVFIPGGMYEGGDAQEGSTTNDSGIEQNLPDPKANWVTRLKTFFGLPGGKPGNVAAGVGGTLVTTGIKALDTDVAAGVASISIRKNLNLCEGAGNCWVPDDALRIRGYLGEAPKNYRGVGEVFIQREWEFIPFTRLVKDL